MTRLTITDHIRNLFARKGRIDPWDIPIEVRIENCPRCSARIELVENLWVCGKCRRHHLAPTTSCQHRECTGETRKLGPMYVCLGCRDREEVVRYLREDLPGQSVPEELTSTPPCGWRGKPGEFGKRWL